MRQHLLQLIAQGKIKQILQELGQYAEEQDHTGLSSQIALLSARFQNYEKGKLLGTTSNEEQQRNLNQLNETILTLIENEFAVNTDASPTNRIRESVEAEQAPSSSSKKKDYWKYVVGVSVIVGILAGIAGILGWLNITPGGGATGSRQLTVRVHELGARDKIVTEGKIMVDIGNRRDPKPIGPDGEVDFEEIDAEFLKKPIDIQFIDSKNYQAAYPDSQYVFEGEPIYFAVTSNCRFCKLCGTIQNVNNEFVSGAVVLIKNLQLQDSTNASGYFEIEVPSGQASEEYAVAVLVDGKIVKEMFITPSATCAVEILLEN